MTIGLRCVGLRAVIRAAVALEAALPRPQDQVGDALRSPQRWRHLVQSRLLFLHPTVGAFFFDRKVKIDYKF